MKDYSETQILVVKKSVFEALVTYIKAMTKLLMKISSASDDTPIKAFSFQMRDAMLAKEAYEYAKQLAESEASINRDKKDELP